MGTIGRMESDFVFGYSVSFCSFCSGLTLWISVIGEPTEGNGLQELRPSPRVSRTFDEFFDLTRWLWPRRSQRLRPPSAVPQAREHRRASQSLFGFMIQRPSEPIHKPLGDPSGEKIGPRMSAYLRRSRPYYG